MSPTRLPVTPVRQGSIRIVGATVIDGTGAEPRTADVEVVDGRIVAIGVGPAATRAEATVDASGLFLTAGLVDTHVHLTMPNESNPEADRLKFMEEHAFATAESMRLTVEAGVTAVRDLAGLTPGYRRAVEAGLIAGPRMHLAITMLSPTGGHADPVRANRSLPAYSDFEPIPSVGVVDSDDEVVKAIRTLVRTGADVVKICTTGGISTPEDSPDDLGIPERQVRLMVAELARRGGRPIAAHAQGNEGALAAVRGGVTSLEHGYEMSDELIEEMLARGTVLVPTLSTLSLSPDPAKKPPQVVAKKLEWQVRGRDAARRAIEAGVPVAMGTDAGIHPHGRNGAEMGHLVDAGMTPLQALHACTIQGARLLGLADHLGSVEVGKLADLVLWDVDPLSAPHVLSDASRARTVLQAGRAAKDLDGRIG
ncbi:metal-dependent hydrolase family protein [Demequina gelatinilytica]|uniref:metal-dependent hydrolase family protein n=1 Tax=Demequina gelatinilytica TaxID=1638980 RepID=UPI0007851CC9|nr:amidohydrolase family protein [Demequina gelatinilytica]